MVGAQSFTEKIFIVKELTLYEDKKKRKIIFEILGETCDNLAARCPPG